MSQRRFPKTLKDGARWQIPKDLAPLVRDTQGGLVRLPLFPGAKQEPFTRDVTK